MKEIVIEGFAHYKSSVRLKCYFFPSWPLTPVSPPVNLSTGPDLLPIAVSGGEGVHPDTIGMKTWIGGDRVVMVELVNFPVQPINFFFLVAVVVWFRAIVAKPG